MIEKVSNCRIVEEIGSGGMAVVYKAIQEPLGRVVAIKALKSSISSEPQFSERFEREAKFMAELQQENIINVHDFIKYGGTMFIVMEYVKGVDLYDLLDKPVQLPVEVAAIIALQVARALNHAHFRGIIHRDIKPANIMLSNRGEVKLMDFGIARAEDLSDLTQTGTGLGTPSYMSPEQVLGDKVDARTDIWSLGVVFYQMLTGHKPFMEDSNKSVLMKIRLDRFTPARRINPKVPRALERILARCMEKLPEDRYPSIQSLIHDLEDFLASRVVVNYNAYLVRFFQEKGVMTEEEVSGILNTEALQFGQRTIREDRKALRSISLVYAVVLAIFLFGGLVIQLVSQDTAPRAPKAAAGTVLAPYEAGYLKVVADPWAEVRVDGMLLEETPFSSPLPLAPGVHYVQLVNPYFKSVTREVVVEAGKTTEINEKLAMDKKSAEEKTR